MNYKFFTFGMPLLACIAVANLISSAVEIPWAEAGKDLVRIQSGEGDGEAVAESDRGNQTIRKELARLGVHDRVGYITDGRPGDDLNQIYYLTQYALLPIIVDRTSHDSRYVIGNFHYSKTDVNGISGLRPLLAAGPYILFQRTP